MYYRAEKTEILTDDLQQVSLSKAFILAFEFFSFRIFHVNAGGKIEILNI